MIRKLVVATAVVTGLVLSGPLGGNQVGAKDYVNVFGVVVVGDERSTRRDPNQPYREPPWVCIANHPLNLGVCLYDPLPNGLPF